ncbi:MULTISPECIES: radical SAM protein [Bartonella]|uniref:radical SAM protein n=2 Tax=Bartonellaceae TaxID=772 RepID=UPI0023620F10|nr:MULTISPECIES: radical SAM protein [Bartonella]
MLKELEKNGFLLKKETLISASDSIFDLKKLWVPVTPIIHIIQNCNSPCTICDCWKIKEKDWHTPESLIPLFRMLKEKGAASVMLSGGEPLMHPKLKDILLTLNELGLPVELNTNGILLHKNLWISQYDIKEIVISMDSTSIQGYYDIRGANKFDRVWKNIETVKNLQPLQSIGIRATVTKEILENIINFIDFCISKDVDYIGFSPLDTSSFSFSRKNNTKDRSKALRNKTLPPNASLFHLRDELSRKESPLQVYIDKKFQEKKISWTSQNFVNCINYYLGENSTYVSSPLMCLFPFSSLVLDYNGDLKNCFYSEAFGNLQNYEAIDWSAQSVLKSLKESGACSGCRGKVFCG